MLGVEWWKHQFGVKNTRTFCFVLSKSLGFSFCFWYSLGGYLFLKTALKVVFFLTVFNTAAANFRLSPPTATRSRRCLRTCHPPPSGKARCPTWLSWASNPGKKSQKIDITCPKPEIPVLKVITPSMLIESSIYRWLLSTLKLNIS